MKIKLIAPHARSENSISSAETFKLQRVNLPLLAALTPPEHGVTLVDEAFAPDKIAEEVDLVGITVMSDLALRAYEIADTYRQRGVKVVMGGTHATVLPTEALAHADAVVVGEAEEVWPKLLSDAASGGMKRIYRAAQFAGLENLPRPRRDLLPKTTGRGYTPTAVCIETARGCPYDCEFCSVGSVAGHRQRCRSVSDVIAEIESVDSPTLFFTDDAFALDRVRAKRLFEEMIPLQRRWVGQGTVSLAEDIGLLRAMKRSGCVGLLIGFESVQKQPSSGLRKINHLRIDFVEATRRFHEEGIIVLGAFVFGFDHENRNVFDETYEFIMRCRIDCVELRILTPFPGTRLYSRLLKEGRLFLPQWWLRGYPPDTLLFQPKEMTPEELIEGFARLNRGVYSYAAIVRRFFGMSPWKRTVLSSRAYAGFNLATRKRYLKSITIPQPFAGSLDFAAQDKPERLSGSL